MTYADQTEYTLSVIDQEDLQILERISAVLGVPSSTFIAAAADDTETDSVSFEEQASNLYHLFKTIRNSKQRRLCFDLVKAFADGPALGF